MLTTLEFRLQAALSGRTVLSSLFALAVAVAAPVSVLAQDAGEANARLLEIVPSDSQGDSAAVEGSAVAAETDPGGEVAPAAIEAQAEVAPEAGTDEAGSGEAAAEGEAAATESAAEALADLAEGAAAPQADAFAALKLDTALGAIDVQKLLETAGYEVSILEREPQNRYQLLAKGAEGLEDLWLHLDGDTGKVLSHEYVDAADYENGEPVKEVPAHANPGYVDPGHGYPGYADPGRWQGYRPGNQYGRGGYGTGSSGY